MELTSTTEKSEKETARQSWRRRALKIVLWIAAVPVALAVLLTIYFYIGGIEWGDWMIPNETELRLELRDVPDEENAYLALRALTNLYHVAESDGSNKEISDKTFVSQYKDPFFSEGDEESFAEWTAIRSAPSSPKRATRILTDNEEFLKGLRAALLLKGYAEVDKRMEDAKRKVEGWSPWTSRLPLYKPFIEFSQLVALRAQVALERGDVKSAVPAIGEIHALGQLLKVNNEALVVWLVGASIEKISFRKMCDVVAMGKATDENIERFSKMVAVSEANAPMAWERGLKAESMRHLEGVEWICNLKSADEMWREVYCAKSGELSGDHRPPPPLLYRLIFGWPGLFRFAFHRREMLYRQAMLDRAMLAGDDYLMEMILGEMPRNPLRPNFFGNVEAVGPILSPYVKADRLDRLRPRLVLATEKWRRVHSGENPPTLDALVPDYLAAVPRDPWSKSGEPIKYDAALGVAWSVGKDGKYDYRKVAKERAAGNKASVDADTQKYAFRLDGKPIGLSESDVCRPAHP